MKLLRKLYTLGFNPDIEKLYPEVRFPVPKNTPMISPFIKWDHSKSWFVPRWDERLKPSEMIFDVSVESDESPEKYLVDHFIDGRYLYPASGYIVLAWKALAEMIHKNYETLPVVFEDVTIHRATILPKTACGGDDACNTFCGSKSSCRPGVKVWRLTSYGTVGRNFRYALRYALPVTVSVERKVTFIVYITYIGKKFEISEGSSIVCTGRVKILEETEKKDFVQSFKEEHVTNLPLNASDVYKEFKLRGYEYGPNFQGIIGADFEGNTSLLKWTGEWVAFLDCLFQFTILHSQERALSLPTRMKKLSIDPVFHKKVIEKCPKGVPTFLNKYTQKITCGGVEAKSVNVEFAPRHPIRQIPLLQEYHFFPYHEENILSKSSQKTLLKYIDICSSVAKMTLELLGKNRNEVSSILNGSQFADYASTTSYLEFQTNSHVLLKSLCAIMDDVTNKDFEGQLGKHVNSYLLQRDLDMLSETLLQENPLRGVLDIVLENIVENKLKVAEVSYSSRPLCAKINELLQTNSVSINYAIAHSNLDVLNRSCLPSGNIDVSSWDPDTSLTFKDIDLFVMKYLDSSKEDHTRILRAASATIKDGGFILILQKTHLVPAEMFLSTIGKMPTLVFSEPDLEHTFKELKLRVICKKSDSLTSTLYLLRKGPFSSYQDVVIPVEVGKYKKWVPELKENINEVLNQSTVSKRIWLVSEGTNCSGIVGLVNCLRLEPGGSSIRCVFISEGTSELPQFNPQNQFYKDIIENDLTMNVFKTNTWGSYRHFKMPEVIAGQVFQSIHLIQRIIVARSFAG
ncbi:fatty acid synthase [Trichonephila clavipes]|nr:fatty acid synthase [Trichonephila clavipes]